MMLAHLTRIMVRRRVKRVGERCQASVCPYAGPRIAAACEGRANRGSVDELMDW